MKIENTRTLKIPLLPHEDRFVTFEFKYDVSTNLWVMSATTECLDDLDDLFIEYLDKN